MDITLQYNMQICAFAYSWVLINIYFLKKKISENKIIYS